MSMLNMQTNIVISEIYLVLKDQINKNKIMP